MVKFWKRNQGVKKRRNFFSFERVSTCHRVFSIITSTILALTIFVCAIMTVTDAAGTEYDVSGWNGIAIASIIVALFQLISNLPYLLLWGRERWEKKAFNVWAGYHIFGSMASITLFFLAFYLVETHSAELRKGFWSQFKLQLEKADATMEDMMICIDFLGLNSFFDAFLVLYPPLSKIWNRNSPDNVNISLN
ncbi:unnamed protein product [Allacma fusca]|uniref:Uncharacterized protein n=1 Tax=Allacma fusca TaxID=39272 RepID=A0A8J2LIA4_9HEXA|nr:unnamed protein product [Allacma fusca]